MNATIFRRVMLGTLLLPLLGALLAVVVQAFRVSSRPPEFVATGTVTVAAQFSPKGQATAVEIRQLEDFYGTQIEVLQSGRLKANALARVQGMHPGLEEQEVTLRVSPVKDAMILKIEVIGSEPEFTWRYCDALLDEYVSMRKEMSSIREDGIVNQVVSEVRIREERLVISKAKWEAFLRTQSGLELLAGERTRLSQLVSQLRGEIESLKASSSTDTSAPAKIEAVNVRLKEAESKLNEVNNRLVESESLKSDYERTRREYEVWLEKRDVISSYIPEGEAITIMDRPSGATQVEHDLTRSLAVAAGVGFAICLAFTLLISWLAASRAPVPSVPPPLVARE